MDEKENTIPKLPEEEVKLYKEILETWKDKQIDKLDEELKELGLEILKMSLNLSRLKQAELYTVDEVSITMHRQIIRIFNEMADVSLMLNLFLIPWRDNYYPDDHINDYYSFWKAHKLERTTTKLVNWKLINKSKVIVNDDNG